MGDAQFYIRHFSSPQKLLSYRGFKPKLREFVLGLTASGSAIRQRALLVEAAWGASNARPGTRRLECTS